MNKVVKIPLISKTERDGKEIPYKDICRILWDLQKITREIKNKSVQLCWEWQGFASDYKKQTDNYPKDKDVLGYTLAGYIYDKTKDSELITSSVSTTENLVIKAFNNDKKQILKGEKSILSFKENQPIDLHGNAIRLKYNETDKNFYFSLSLLSKSGRKKYDISSPLLFCATVRDKSVRTILERCVDGVYGISASKLIYNKKKRQWFLNLSYSFEAKNHDLNKNKILGMNLGINYPVVASVNGDYERLSVQGGELDTFRAKITARKYSLSKQRPFCGDGSIGHGYNTRMKPVLKIEDTIARFRDTYNHKISRSIVEYAIKNGCGTIQLEDLSSIADNEMNKADKEKDEKKITEQQYKIRNAYLRNWSYYDLQQKIEYKAKENGIDVVYINPAYTSQRCSKCGAIHEENRPTNLKFKCVECGYEENADYNASQNIAIKDIDKIIEQTLSGKKLENKGADTKDT